MSAILSIVGVPFVKAYAYLGWTGLLSIPLWVAAFAMLLKYRRDDRRNVRYLAALVLGLAAALLADFAATSASKIVIDRTEEIEAARAQQRHSRLNEFGEADMAGQMHFAEDSAPESPSVAPAADSAESAIGSALDDMNPEHRFGEKKKRASGRTEKVGNAAEIYEEKAKEEKPPRTMKEPDVIFAGRVNWLNLRIARIAFFLALALLVWDYLVRFNRWMPGYPALPLSAPWIDSISKKDFECTARDDRKEQFLRDLVHRGETFIVAADGTRLLDSVDSVERLDIPLGRGESAKHLRMFGFPVLSVKEGDPRGWEFIFDAAWFNRYAVVYNGSTSALLAALGSYLGDRHATRAFARRTVNLVLPSGAIGGDESRRAFMRLLRPANWRLCEFVPAPKEETPVPDGKAAVDESAAPATPAKPAKTLSPEEEAARKAKNAAIAAKFAKMAGGKGATTAGGVAAPEPPAAAAPEKPTVKAEAAAPVASEPAAPAKPAEPVSEKSTEAPKAAPAKPAAKSAPASQPAAKPAPAKPAPAPIAKPADDAAKAARLARLQAKFGKGGATTVGGAAAPEPPAATAPVKPAVKAETPASAATPAPQPAAKPAVTETAKPAAAPAPKAEPAPAPIAKPADDAAKAARLARLQAKFGKGGVPASAESHPAPAVAPVKAEAPAKPAPQSAPAAAAKPADDVAKAARLARLQAKFGGKGGATTVGGAAAPEPPAATAPVKPAVKAGATAPAKSAAAPEPPAATAPVKPVVKAEATAPAKSAPVATESPVAAAPAPAKPAPAPIAPAPAPEKPVEAPKSAPVVADRKPAPKFIIKHGATAQAANPEPQLSPEEKLRAMRAEHLKVKFGKPKTVQPVEPVVKNEVVEQPVPQPQDTPVAPVAKAENPAPQPQSAEPHTKLEFGKISISLDDLDLPQEPAQPAADDDVVVVAYSRELQGKSYADVSSGAASPAVPAKTGGSPSSRPSAPGSSGKHGIRIIRKK